MSTDKSTFSISVPIGKWHPILPAALRSLAVQEPHPEVAILNASEDSRVDRAIAQSGLRVSYRRDGPDTGQSAAIIEGWQNTQGRFVGWLNADDLLLRGALSEAHSKLEAHPEAGAVYANSVIINAGRNITGLHSAPGQSACLMTRTNPVSQPSCFLRRSAVEAVGGLDQSLDFVMDWDLWVRLLEGGWDMLRLDCIWSAVFWGAGTKTASMPIRRIQEVIQLLQPRVGALGAAKALGSMALDGRIGRLLFRYSRSGRQRLRHETEGVLVTAAHHPGECPSEKTLIRIPNAFNTPRRTLEVLSTKGALCVDVQRGDVMSLNRSCIHISFHEPIEPGHDAALVLRAEGPTAARFVTARWLS